MHPDIEKLGIELAQAVHQALIREGVHQVESCQVATGAIADTLGFPPLEGATSTEGTAGKQAEPLESNGRAR